MAFAKCISEHSQFDQIIRYVRSRVRPPHHLQTPEVFYEAELNANSNPSDIIESETIKDTIDGMTKSALEMASILYTIKSDDVRCNAVVGKHIFLKNRQIRDTRRGKLRISNRDMKLLCFEMQNDQYEKDKYS